MAIYHDFMVSSLSLTDLAEATGFEARTIRSYIERGLLPSSDMRGRGATYSAEHLARLQVIQALRRARPKITLSEIRILLQQLKPEQIKSLAGGSISAIVDPVDELAPAADDHHVNSVEEEEGAIDWDQVAKKLTGPERLVRLLHEMSGFRPLVDGSKVEAWHRITVTQDIELSVRAEFSPDQLAAFRELASLLRRLLQHTDAIRTEGD